jgi:hypothetical protein
VFFDAARVWNQQGLNFGDQSIDSVGGGIRFWIVYNIIGDIEVAHTLDRVVGSDSGSQTTKFLLDLAIRF